MLDLFARGPPLPLSDKHNDKGGGDLMADILHGLLEVLSVPFLVIMILAGLIAGRIEKRR